ncbi:hypothetical protein Tco_0817359 [Tanacetum coccineum]
MSSDNASSAVTYTSVSSDLNGPSSWDIPLVNTGKIPDMDPYKEVAQQGKTHPLSPAYVPDLMELDEHVPVYVPEPKHPDYHAPSDDDIQDTDADSIDYPDEPEDGEEDDDEDPEEDPSKEHEPEDDDNDDDTDDEDEEHTEDEEEEHLDPADSSMVPVVDLTRLYRAQKTVRLEPPISASMEAHIAEHAAASIPPTSPTYDQAPLGHRAAMIRMRDDIPEEDMPPRRRFVLTAPSPGCDVAESSTAATRAPRGQYDFIDTVVIGQGLICSPGHNARTIARAADRAEDVGYVKALHASKNRMMTSIEEVNLRVSYQAQVHRQESEDFYTQLHDARTDRRDIRLEIDVLRLIRWRTPAVAVRIMPVTRQGANKAMTPESIQVMIDRAIQRNSTHTQDDASHNSGRGLRRPVQLARVCSYTDFMKCQPLNFKGTEGVVGLYQWLEKMESVFHISGCAIDNQGTLKKKLTDKYCPKGKIKKLEIELWNLRIDKYINGLPDNIHGNVMSARPKTLDDAIELANDLMDQKLPRAYTAGPGEKKAYTGNLPLCTKCNYHHTGQYTPKCGNCKRYGHTINDCRVNNNNKNQKARACYECGNTGHIKKNFPKLKNCGNGNGNGTAQGRTYALGGRDASPDSNIITSTFLLNKRYATVLFDTCADKSFVSNTFSALINITPTTLESHYDVELMGKS